MSFHSKDLPSFLVYSFPVIPNRWAWFHDIWTCSAKVLEYWMIFSLKTKSNCSSKFWRKWNVPLVLLERSWRARFNGVYFKIWILNVGDIDFWVISAAENSNKFQKTKRKISWGRGNARANSTGHTSEVWKNNLWEHIQKGLLEPTTTSSFNHLNQVCLPV
jgi:hypothetical protein